MPKKDRQCAARVSKWHRRAKPDGAVHRRGDARTIDHRQIGREQGDPRRMRDLDDRRLRRNRVHLIAAARMAILGRSGLGVRNRPTTVGTLRHGDLRRLGLRARGEAQKVRNACQHQGQRQQQCGKDSHQRVSPTGEQHNYTLSRPRGHLDSRPREENGETGASKAGALGGQRGRNPRHTQTRPLLLEFSTRWRQPPPGEPLPGGSLSPILSRKITHNANTSIPSPRRGPIAVGNLPPPANHSREPGPFHRGDTSPVPTPAPEGASDKSIFRPRPRQGRPPWRRPLYRSCFPPTRTGSSKRADAANSGIRTTAPRTRPPKRVSD